MNQKKKRQLNNQETSMIYAMPRRTISELGGAEREIVRVRGRVLKVMGFVQKNLIARTEQDYEDMEVTKEEVLAEYEYAEVLEPLAKQYDDIEKRKQKSGDKIAGAWKTGWEERFGLLMPL